jgi:hypothetical protein
VTTIINDIFGSEALCVVNMAGATNTNVADAVHAVSNLSSSVHFESAILRKKVGY